MAGTAEAQERVQMYEMRVDLEKAQLAGKLRAAVEMKTTVGAPYSGEATTEAVQVLADGNRIVRRSIVRIYRDSEGRVRRENVTADGSRVESVTIVDPVSGSNVMLDPVNRIAFGDPGKVAGRSDESAREVERKKLERAELEAKMEPRAEPDKRDIEMAMRGEPRAPGPVALPRRPSPERERVNGEASRQDLGQRTFDGVVARGTRTTTVLAAGAIGNEQPIRIVSEEWFAPDLQLLVLTKYSDPRSGDTTYTLSNIVRTEPDHSLFEVPADYSVKPVRARE
jgi:hypothetical protein